MKLTKEQIAIYESDAHVKRIEARAGSGKTYILQKEIEKYVNERILYLVYGRNIKAYAEELFSECDYVDVRTIHSHAYRSGNIKWKPSPSAISIPTILSYLDTKDIKENRLHEVSAIIRDLLVYYTNIADKTIDLAYDGYKIYLSGSLLEFYTIYSDQIKRVCKMLLEKWYYKELDCPHDFYVKYSYISGSFQKALKKYDRIVIDEAQDLSPIMIDVLQNFPGKISIVGDSFQSIYSFRYVENALKRIKSDCIYTLTKSFRFGEEIGEFVTEYMQTVIDDDFIIRGNELVDSYVSFLKPTKDYDNCVFLARTNLELVSQAIYYSSQDIDCYFERDVMYIFNALEDIWHLYNQRNYKVKDELIKSFANYHEFVEFVNNTDDTYLMSLIQILTKYSTYMPELIYDLQKLGYAKKDGIGLSTVHSAKGKQYDCVYISHELYTNVQNSVFNENNFEEFRILYVALTRAIYEIVLPIEFQDIVNRGWFEWKTNIERRKEKKQLVEKFW